MARLLPISTITRRGCAKFVGAAIFSAAFTSVITAPESIAAAGDKTKSGASLADATGFSTKVATSDMFEIESSKLAASKASSNDVKMFAQVMVEAHTKTTERLKRIAADDGFADRLPRSMDRKHAAMLDQLKGLSAAQFDRKYVEMQVTAHKDAVGVFDAYASKGTHPTLKQFARETVPDIRQHLEHAQGLSRKLQTA